MLFLCASGLERAKVFENEGGVGSVSELAHSGGPVSVAPLGFKRAPRDGAQTSHLGRFFRGITRDPIPSGKCFFFSEISLSIFLLCDI